MSGQAGLIALRDRLYALMTRCLAEGQAREFEGIEERLSLDPARAAHADFLREKAPRYREALEAWFARKRPENPFDEALAFSDILFNHGLYFDAHEYLESAWKAAAGGRKSCLQGLIQISAAFHKLELDSEARAGALELLEKGLRNLETGKSVLEESVVEDIAARLSPVLAAMRSGGFRLAEVPRLSWAEPA